MSYRGRDLDLRTPERWPAPPAPWRAEDTTAGALMVDEVVLACCNHAFDLALAHRAREVRVEHLLNAMARTDAAMAVMAGYGIDIAGLRQDTAHVIASDATAVPGSERLSPRRSQELADILNHAAGSAARRSASATIADVLHALFEMNSDQAGLVMLKRNTPGWQQRSVEPGRSEPLPPLVGTYHYDPRYVAADARSAEPPREWVRVPASPPPYYQGQTGGYYGSEGPQQAYYPAEPQPAPPPPQPMAPPPPPAVQAAPQNVTDVVQNTRLDLLERTIRELTSELSAERKMVSQLAGEVRREQNGDATRTVRINQDERPPQSHDYVIGSARAEAVAPPQLVDHLIMIERNVDAKFADLARGWTVLGERLQALEQTVAAGRGDGPLPTAMLDQLQSLESIGSTIGMLAERLSGIERQLAVRQTAAVNLEPIVERLAAIEHAQALRPAATSAALAPVIERLAAIERHQASRPAADGDLSPLFDRLGTIERSFASRASVDLSPLNERLAALDARLGQFERRLENGIAGAERAQQQQAERLRPIEEALVAQRNQIAQLGTHLAAEVKQLGKGVADQVAGTELLQSLVADRFKDVAGSLDQSRAELISRIDGQRGETAVTIADFGNRVAALEKVIQGFGQRTLDLHSAHGADLVELHNALVKLNTNQQTLAGTLDQWRLDSGTELNTLLTRLDGVERTSAKPMQLLENLQSNLQELQRVAMRREEQRGRFKQWLMGTDDWYGASWEHATTRDRPVNGTTTAMRTTPPSGR